MKLKAFIAGLQKIADEHPNLEVIYSCDDEGNAFQKVYHTGTIGNFDPQDACFQSAKNLRESESEAEINAVCIN